MFDKDNPIPRAEDTSIGISYTALLSDFGDKLGKKTRMDMNLGLLSKLGFIERRGDVILEGPLLDLMMDTDVLKERIINGALADVFKRAPLAAVPRKPTPPTTPNRQWPKPRRPKPTEPRSKAHVPH
jgi:hypothetical protein